MDSPLSVVFVSWEITADGYTEYVIRVTDGRMVWTIKRRYSAFRDLHDVLRTKTENLPAVPGKKLFGNLDPGFIQKRQSELQSYMDALLARPDIAKLREVRSFLDASNASNRLPAVGAGQNSNAASMIGGVAGDAVDKKNSENRDLLTKKSQQKLSSIVDSTAARFIDLSVTPSPLDDDEINRKKRAYQARVDAVLKSSVPVPTSFFSVPTPDPSASVDVLLSAPSLKGSNTEKLLNSSLASICSAIESSSVSGDWANKVVVVLPPIVPSS